MAGLRRRLISSSLLSVMALELLARGSGLGWMQAGAWAAMAAATAASWRRLGLREGYLLTLCAALAGILWTSRPAPAAVLALALDQAAFLMAFILLLGLLHEAASTSPSVAECGRWLTRQPPGRRYYALYGGTGIMAVLFNLGVVSFLVPLIQRGIESGTPGDALNPVRQRRQVSAMLRGFAWSVVWSPTAIAPLAVMELMDGIDRQRWVLLGLAIFAGMMVLGALEDRLRFRAYRPRAARGAAAFPTRAALMVLAASSWLLVIAATAARLTGEGAVFGLLAACPVMLFGWLWVQNRRAGPGARTAMRARLREIAADGLPRAAPVAVTLAASGFIGRAAAELVPAAAVAGALGLDAVPQFVLLSLIPVALSVLSLLALSPIVMAVFFGSLFGALPVPAADPTLIALAISCGWALSMTFSPFATVVLLIDRVGAIAPRRLTWGWNLLYSLLAALALVPVFAVLTGGR